jgi:hypothetical protein
VTRLNLSNVKYLSQGEAYAWPVTVANVKSGDGISKIYLTLKKLLSDADGAAALQKAITTGLVSGVGQITDTGSVSLLAAGRFDFTSAQTSALSPQDFFFDIKAIPASGLGFLVDSGIVRVSQGVTLSNT